MTRDRLTRSGGILLLTLVVAALAYAGWFRLAGGHWERVETPSMGTTAPVGTLLWVQPVDPAALEVGDFITFHPPGSAGVTYSHRVAVLDDGTLGTQGEISSPDPWPLVEDDVVGQVVQAWPGVGWLVLATPYLAVGALATTAIVAVCRGRGRLPIGVLGATVTLTVAVVVLQPFTRAEQLAFAPTSQGARATYVSTGLLPIRLSGPSGTHVDLSAGQVGSVTTTAQDTDGRASVDLQPHIPFLFWILLVLGCFVPALWTLAIGVRLPEPRHLATAD